MSDSRSQEDALKEKFHNKMIEIYKIADKEYGYRPTRFLNLLSELGGVETAKNLINKAEATDGFTKLWELNRLDLSVEALVIAEEFQPLFTDKEIETCKNRLAEYGYFD